MWGKMRLIFFILCISIIVGCNGNGIPVTPSMEQGEILITAAIWHPDERMIEIKMDPFPSSTWVDSDNWIMYINGKTIPMGGGNGNPVVRPNAPLENPPTGVLIGTLPWVSPLTNVDFPCCGTIQFYIPGESLTNEYEYNLASLGCETACQEDCSTSPSQEVTFEEETVIELIASQENKITLDDGMEVEVGSNTLNGDATLYVAKIALNKTKSSANLTLHSLYEIALMGDNPSLNGTVKLKFPIPSGLTEDKIVIGHFHEGNLEIIKGSLIAGKYQIVVSGFSEFGVYSKNSDNEVSTQDLNNEISGYLSASAPPPKPVFITKSGTWFYWRSDYTIDWEDSSYAVKTYTLQEYYDDFDLNEGPDNEYTHRGILGTDYTIKDSWTNLKHQTIYYRIKSYNTLTKLHSEWTEPIKIHLWYNVPPNLSVSTHEVEAGERYKLIWDRQSVATRYEIKESYEDLDGGITTKTILKFEDCDNTQTMLDHFKQLNESFIGTLFYTLEFYTDTLKLPIEKSIPGTYYYSIRSKNIIEEKEYSSPWSVDPPESGNVYVKVLPNPETATKDAEIHDIKIITDDDPLQLNKWYSVEVTLENTGDVTQNFKVSGDGYYTDFEDEDVFEEIDPDKYGYARFKCKFTGPLTDSRHLTFWVYDEYDNELDGYWEEYYFVSDPISPPTVTASQGTHDNKVFVSWDKPEKANYYKLYRAYVHGGPKEELTGWIVVNTYYDYKITPGKYYYYYVRSATDYQGVNHSEFSDPAEGWAYDPDAPPEINGTISINAPNDFELYSYQSAEVLVTNTGNVAHTFTVKGVTSPEPKGLRFVDGENEDTIFLEDGESGNLIFYYLCFGESTDDRNLTFRLYENASDSSSDYLDKDTKIIHLSESTPVIALWTMTGDLSFGTVQVGQTSQKTLTIFNTGTAPLEVTGIHYPSGFSGDWSGSIPVDDYHDVTVTFAPTADTTYGGTLTVYSNASSGTNTMSISGTGKPSEKEEIGDVCYQFANAMADENWSKAKTYCIPNSQAIEIVNEYASLFYELHDICDQFSYQCSSITITSDAIVISGSNATVTTTVGTCTMTCDDVSVSAAGYDIYYLKKVDGSWLISEIGGDAYNEITKGMSLLRDS